MSTIQQLRLHGPGEVRLDDVETPQPGPRDVVVRVQACGICGSDLGYIKVGGIAGPVSDPIPLGHEFSAVVDRVGAEVSTYRPGMRVVVNPLAAGNNIGNGGDAGAFAREIVIRDVEQAPTLFPIPDDLPFDQAALAEPLGVALQAVERAGVAAGDKVTIFGAGPIGLMTLAALLYRGFSDVAIVDLSDNRLGIAAALGATLTLNPERDDVWQRLRELHGTEMFLGFLPTAGAHAYIEASGAAAVIPDIINQARPGATICVVALHRQPIPVDFSMVLAKQLTLAGSMAYPEDYAETVRILAEVDLSAVITHRFPLSEFSAALRIARNPSLAGKVLIEP